MNEIQTCLVVVDRTISLLRLIIQEVDEVDKQEWHTSESCFELILQSLHNHASELARRSTTLTYEQAPTHGYVNFVILVQSSFHLCAILACQPHQPPGLSIAKGLYVVRSTTTRHVCISFILVAPALIILSARSRTEFKNRR